MITDAYKQGICILNRHFESKVEIKPDTLVACFKIHLAVCTCNLCNACLVNLHR